MRSDSLVHGVDAAGLQLRGGLFAEPELDGAESALGMASDRPCELIGREALPETVARVGGKSIAVPAEKAIQSLAQRRA
jgi:hypothetical protein